MSSASAPTSTHPANPSQEYLDFMAQYGFTNERVKKSRPMWEVLSCMCLNSEQCKQLVRGWNELGESHAHMLEYVGIPKRSDKKTPLGTHINGFRDAVFRHLLGQGINSKAHKDWLNSPERSTTYVALHHFKPCLRDAIRRSKLEPTHIKKYRCSKEEGVRAGLTDADKCKVPLPKEEPNAYFYYLLPNNVNLDDIEHEQEYAKVQSKIEMNAASTVAVSDMKRKVSTGNFASSVVMKHNTSTEQQRRSSPVEREWEIHTRDISQRPQFYALKMRKMESQLEAVQKQLHQMALSKEQQDKKHAEEMKLLRAGLKKSKWL
eukprot:scaffold147346_cov53-Cyclotella_meneghiniana.AAC.5